MANRSFGAINNKLVMNSAMGSMSAMASRSIGAITEELVRNLETTFQWQNEMNISEIVKGGSRGHGTALADKSDLDLVAYSRDINPADVIKNGVRDILHKFDRYLTFTYGQNYSKKKEGGGMTPYALQFKLYGQLEVDLLPSPHWDTHDEYLSYMTRLSSGDRRNFKCSEAKWQKEFFKRQPNEVKEFTRRAKAWCKSRKWPYGKYKPSSFLLGLLIAEAYRRCSSFNKDARSVEAELKHMVENHRNLNVCWSGSDTCRLYDRLVSARHLLRSPCILDPVNPHNNVYYSCTIWPEFVKLVPTLDLTKAVY